MERRNKNISKVVQLQSDKEKLQKELAELRTSKAGVDAELKLAADEVLRLTAEAHRLREESKAKELEHEAELRKQKVEAEKLLKENAELASSRRDAIHTAFREGERQATVKYQGQVDEISKISFEECLVMR